VTDNNLVKAETLRQFCIEALEKVGVPKDDARIVADMQVEADLRGVHSHGTGAIYGYVQRLKQNGTNPRPNITFVKESPHHALVDGDRGLGQLVAFKSMEMCIAKARQSGMAAVGVRCSTHFGATANYSMMALKEDLIGFATTNAAAMIAPTGGLTGIFGTNPVSFAVPTGHSYPMVLDIAVTVVAQQKIVQALREERKIPLDWGLDNEGKPTDDPRTALTSGLMPPIGGHKGYGLAMVVEVLSAILTGAYFGRATEPATWRPDSTLNVGHFFAALDPTMFMPIDEFKSRMEKLIEQIKGSTLMPGVEKVYIPGEIEYQKREQSLKEGIPLPPATLSQLERLQQEMELKTTLF
jgi:LDH2 family malate/lactate/ureidoglycolate dehydrogenase